ncbi:TlpA family protein disulfide reductase [Aestuariibacter sp. GS-14]|uniref:TlpA family protein disulfide reductase n=1 Tax=Aestuariibacter sp. GS-14 TaxID=2590670 RepID=UPI001127E8C3|nr:TlpA disulfide reductase family protein [Aestuariibacter sp. GS-14]TPV62234.1 TlpA family protein disulfide reductase [Aestuariibacter sp. GS-14]
MTGITLRRLVVAATLTITATLAAWLPFASSAQQANLAGEVLAPDLTFHAADGETFSLQQRWEKKPVLLYFWATWCPYCKKATPNVTALHHDFGDSIDVLGINVAINDTQEKMHAYLHDYGVDFPVMFDAQAELTSEFMVTGTPVFVVLSQRGEILYRSHRYPAGIESVLVRNF